MMFARNIVKYWDKFDGADDDWCLTLVKEKVPRNYEQYSVVLYWSDSCPIQNYSQWRITLPLADFGTCVSKEQFLIPHQKSWTLRFRGMHGCRVWNTLSWPMMGAAVWSQSDLYVPSIPLTADLQTCKRDASTRNISYITWQAFNLIVRLGIVSSYWW